MNFDISISVNTVATMFLLIIVGYIARKTNIIDKSLSKKLSNLIVCLAMPALMISAFLETEYSKANLISGGYAVIIGFVIHIFAYIIGTLGSKVVRDKKERQIFVYSEIFENCAFYGFPVISAILGAQGLFWAAFYNITFNILQWTLGMYILGKANSDIKMNPKKMFINFGTIPSLIGVLIYITQIKMPEPVVGSLKYMGNLCTPISMLIIGGVLAELPFKKIFTKYSCYFLAVCKNMILPIVIGFIAVLTKLTPEMGLFCALMAGMPTAASTTVFAEKYDIAPQYAATCVGFSTLLSVATIPLITYIFTLI